MYGLGLQVRTRLLIVMVDERSGLVLWVGLGVLGSKMRWDWIGGRVDMVSMFMNSSESMGLCYFWYCSCQRSHMSERTFFNLFKS